MLNKFITTITSTRLPSRNQIDYIVVKAQRKTSVINCRTFPGACDSHHVHVRARFDKEKGREIDTEG